VALVSMTAGLIAAFYLRLAAGGAVVLVALAIYAFASLARRHVSGALEEARS
jgi:ABC-type Mn2+/Zn2+ transport system permease subunit